MAQNKWPDELRNKVVKKYKAANPTEDNTLEIADEVDKTVNGVRLVLSQAGVYVKAKSSNTSDKETKSSGPRVSKEAALQGLKDAIAAKGMEVDEDIIKRFTGKAAVYLTQAINV